MASVSKATMRALVSGWFVICAGLVVPGLPAYGAEGHLCVNRRTSLDALIPGICIGPEDPAAAAQIVRVASPVYFLVQMEPTGL